MVQIREAQPDNYTPPLSDEAKAKDIWEHLQRHISGEEADFRRYFVVDVPDQVHEYFSRFLPEPTSVVDGLTVFSMGDVDLWRQDLAYEEGGVYGHWYTTAAIGETPELL